VLQDAVFTLDRFPFLPHHKLDLGQYKLPLTEEGLRSSAKLDTAERSFISRTFGDQRDIGAMLTGEWPVVTYQLGVFNGSGQNQADANDQKDLTGRVVLRPLEALKSFMDVPEVGQLEVGLSGYHRPVHGSTFNKKRLGYEARYEYQNLALKWEYMFGQGTAGSNATTENALTATGWYAQAGYTLAPWIPKLQAVLKFESWDPNELASLDKERDLTLGLNYFIDKSHAKAQLNWVHKDEQGAEIDNDQVIGAFQYAF
jgi:phosphate-selective porin